MEEDLIKKGILKEGEINETMMLNSPEKRKKAFKSILFTIVILVIIVVIIGCIIVYKTIGPGSGGW
ncbi:MAG: hypothetical protein NTZ44_03960 [Candidatus Nomurabacteria bacterium]|nr:hypothetical protein [Candidatus Nomurabacteria bacterium]